MNRMLAAVSALALVAVAAPAFAADNASVTINANVAPKCVVNTSGSGIVTVSAADLAKADGFLNTAFVQEVASGLTSQGITAWCSGNTNTVVLSRTPLKTGNARTVDLVNGFATAVIYDVAVSIAGAKRADDTTPIEGTSDGALIGPGSAGASTSVSNFGATGTGAAVTFVAEAGQTPSAITGLGGNANNGPTSGFPATSANRLLAGAYTGTVILTLSPGL